MGKARQRAHAKTRRKRGSESRPTGQPVPVPAPELDPVSEETDGTGLVRRIVMPYLLLELAEDLSAEWAETATQYWDHVQSPQGNTAITWPYKVRDVTLPADHPSPTPPTTLVGLLAERCIARLRDVECIVCGEHPVVRSRSAVQESRRGYVNPVCGPCRADRARQEREAQQAERQKQQARADRRRAAIDALPVAVSGGHLLSQDLTLQEAVVLRALLIEGVDGQGLIRRVSERPTPLIANWVDGALREAWRRLWAEGIIQPHPSSSVDSFGWTDDDEIRGLYLEWATWYVARGPQGVSLARNCELALEILTGTLASAQWPSGWSPGAEQLAQETIAAEGLRYFLWGLNERDFPVPSETKQAELEAAMVDAAKQYSIGEMHYLSWQPLKSASDAYRLHNGMTVDAATSHAVNQMAKRAPMLRSKGWEAQVYSQPRQLPLATTTEILFQCLGLTPGSTPAPAVAIEARTRAAIADFRYEEYEAAEVRLLEAGPLPDGAWAGILRRLADRSVPTPLPTEGPNSEPFMRLVVDADAALHRSTHSFLAASESDETADRGRLVAGAYSGSHFAAFTVIRTLAGKPDDGADSYETAALVGDQLRVTLVEAYQGALTLEPPF